MQNSTNKKKNGTVTVSPPPPPPPPPPRPLSKSNTKKKAEIVASVPTTSQLSNRNCFYDIFRTIQQYFLDTHTNIVSFCKPLVPVIQEGPSCGIAALSMASQFFDKNVSADEILATAKNCKFTNHGEMFSAYNMATLSNSLLDCEATVMTKLFANYMNIVDHLSNGWPILIPYDTDRNNEPTLNSGRSAHWAVICGLCFGISEDAYSLLDGYSPTRESSILYHLSSKVLIQKLLKFARRISVYAYQGKSKHLGLWDLQCLTLSNNNLFEITDKYDVGDMIIPSVGLKELNDKAVILKPKSV